MKGCMLNFFQELAVMELRAMVPVSVLKDLTVHVARTRAPASTEIAIPPEVASVNPDGTAPRAHLIARVKSEKKARVRIIPRVPENAYALRDGSAPIVPKNVTRVPRPAARVSMVPREMARAPVNQIFTDLIVPINARAVRTEFVTMEEWVTEIAIAHIIFTAPIVRSPVLRNVPKEAEFVSKARASARPDFSVPIVPPRVPVLLDKARATTPENVFVFRDFSEKNAINRAPRAPKVNTNFLLVTLRTTACVKRALPRVPRVNTKLARVRLSLIFCVLNVTDLALLMKLRCVREGVKGRGERVKGEGREGDEG